MLAGAAMTTNECYTIAQRTINALKKSGLRATPDNYKIWYTHLTMGNEELSKELELIYRKTGKVQEDDCKTLFEKHFSANNSRNKIIRIVYTLAKDVSQITDELQQLQYTPNYAKNDHLNRIFVNLYDLSQEIQKQTTNMTEKINFLLHNKNLQKSSSCHNDLKTDIDPYTGLYSREYLDRELPNLCLVSHRLKESISLLLIDFSVLAEKINPDPVIDDIVSAYLSLITDHKKGRDILCKYQEYTYAVILPDTGEESAYILVRNLRTAIIKLSRYHNSLTPLMNQSIKMGLSEFIFPEESSNLKERAEKNLEKILNSVDSTCSTKPNSISLHMNGLAHKNTQ